MTTAEDSLRSALARERVIVVAGAGVSIAATGNAQTASWAGLLEHGIAWVEKDRSPSPAWAQEARGRLSTSETSEFLLVASMVKEALGVEYPRWLKAAFSGLMPTDDALPRAVTALGVPVATTNFDRILEQVTGWRSATWHEPELMHPILLGEARGVAHLHGVWTDADSVVFDAAAYGSVLYTRSAQELQQACALTYSLLFVGVGAAGHDPNIGHLLDWFHEIGWAANRHYWLCLEEDRKTIESTYPVTAVPYGRTHDELAPYLRSLAEIRTPSQRCVPVDEHRDPPAPEPWLVTADAGPWAALTLGDSLWILRAETLGVSSLRDIAVVPEGSHVVALDDSGFRVWLLNLDGSVTEWPSSFPFVAGHASISYVQRVDANAIDVVLRNGHLSRVRLESGRPAVRTVLGENGTAGGPLRDHATGAAVTLRATLDRGPRRATLSVHREQGSEATSMSFETGLDGAERVVVARPLRGGTEPYAVIVEAEGRLVVWRWADLVTPASRTPELAGRR